MANASKSHSLTELHALIIAFVAVLSSFAFQPGLASLADDGPVRAERDLRHDKSKAGGIIVFCARDSKSKSPGHAFAIWGKEDAKKQMCTQAAYGFMPEKGLGVLGPVTGRVAEETLSSQDKADCLVFVKVDQSVFEEAEEIRRRWAAKGSEYKAATRNCVSFIDEVAEKIGLRHPEGSSYTLPHAYVRELWKLSR